MRRCVPWPPSFACSQRPEDGGVESIAIAAASWGTLGAVSLRGTPTFALRPAGSEQPGASSHDGPKSHEPSAARSAGAVYAGFILVSLNDKSRAFPSRDCSYRWTSSASVEVCGARTIHLCLRSSFAEGRCLASIWRHNETNSRNGCDHWSPRSVGGADLGMSSSTRIGCSSACGGSPIAISRAEMPSDQMSAFESYWSCRITSGAIQKGVPTKVQHLDIVAVICPATPKSASLSSPCLDSSTFAALISLWILPSVCR
mmetsp:Transcript_23844/g.59207  ORF Transcript_23844/g.59207 Transcript_23844/m.59207 type:complete len:258 (+) Transcript_23844:1021-1794(+)